MLENHPGEYLCGFSYCVSSSSEVGLHWRRCYHAVTPVTPAVDSGATAGSSPGSSSATCQHLWEDWTRSPGSCRSEGRKGSWLRRVSSLGCRLLEQKSLSNCLKDKVKRYNLGRAKVLVGFKHWADTRRKKGMTSRLGKVGWRYCGRVMIWWKEAYSLTAATWS